jgi:hypothetical protein
LLFKAKKYGSPGNFTGAFSFVTLCGTALQPTVFFTFHFNFYSLQKIFFNKLMKIFLDA